MKKTLLSICLIYLPIILFCQENELRHWRINTSANLSVYAHQSRFAFDNNDSQLSAGLQLGHRFNEKFEMEVGFDFSERHDYIPFVVCTVCEIVGVGNFITENFNLKYLDISVMGNYYFKRSNQFDFFASAGLRYSLLKVKELKKMVNSIDRYPNILANPVIGLGVVFHISDLLELRYESNYMLGIGTATKTDDTNKTNTFSAKRSRSGSA